MPPKSAMNSNLQYVSVRKATFTEGVRIGNAKSLKYWPHYTPSAEEMAEKGFYYTPTNKQGDQVTCFWCGKKEKNLQGEASISSVHFSHNAKCPYAVIYHFLTQYQNDHDMHTFWRRLVEENESPISVLEPHSQISVRLRLATFKNLWKFDSRRKTKVTARGMAEAGFFFAPVDPDDDRVICMYCGCPLSDWDVGDDPREEHENNSRAYRVDDAYPTCYFLESLEEPAEEEASMLSGAELQHVPSSDGPNPQDKSHVTPRIPNSGSSSSSSSSPSPAPAPATDMSSDSSHNKSYDGLMEAMSPLSPGLLSSDPPPQNELDQFDISIDQLSDHETHLDKAPPPIRRYPRRKKQAVFGAKLHEEKSPKSTTSLILEVRKEPEPAELEQDPHSSTDESGDVPPPSAADSSQIHHSTSISVEQDSTEDANFSDSYVDISSSQENAVKQEPPNIGAENKTSRSRFSDDQFGLNEKDIANILNSPKKDRKIRKVKTKQALPLPAIHDLSDQNIGDYDEQNLSFLEKDIRLQPVNSKIVDLEQENSGFQASSSPQKRPISFKLPTSEQSGLDSSLVEVSKTDATKSTDIRDPILIESPEKVNSISEISMVDSDKHMPEVIPEMSSPEKQPSGSKIPCINYEEADDEVILDYQSPEKQRTNAKDESALEHASDPVSESTGIDLGVDTDDGDAPLNVKDSVKKPEPQDSNIQLTLPLSNSIKPGQVNGTIRGKDLSPQENSADSEVEEQKTESNSPESDRKEMTEAKNLEPPLSQSASLDVSKSGLGTHVRSEEEAKKSEMKVKRSMETSSEEPVSKKLKGEGQPILQPKEPTSPKADLISTTANEIGNLHGSAGINPDQSAVTESGESPTKEVVVCPSSYKEYMTDYEKMKKEFADASMDEDNVVASEHTKHEEEKVDRSKDNLEVSTGHNVKQKAPESVKDDHKEPSPEIQEEKPEPIDHEKELPSYIGDSASEAPVLLPIPPSPRKLVHQKQRQSPLKNITAGKPTEKDPESTTQTVDGKVDISPNLEPQETAETSPVESKAQDVSAHNAGHSFAEASVNNQPSTDNEDRLSFSGIQSSTPNKTAQVDSENINTQLPRISLNASLAEIKELEEAIEYVTEIAARGYELHNDVDGTLTDFISAMPEEEEEMTIEKWIQHNAKSCRKIVTDSAERMITHYETEFDRVIEYVESLETID